MNYFLTGGAGSIGIALTLKLLEKPLPNIIVFDNNEYALSKLDTAERKKHGRLTLAVGDLRDRNRLEELLGSVNTVVHLAAIKRVETAECNIGETIKTNILGTMGLIDACRNCGVENLLLISSDKAVPSGNGEIGLYGLTKLVQEKLVLTANKFMHASVVRFGNVIGTKGDVFEIWKQQRNEQRTLTITDKRCKRFYWSLSDATDFILFCLNNMREGGETFVPKMEEFTMVEMARKHFGDDVKFIEIGLRPGEVLTHQLMTETEKKRAKEYDWGWII